MRISPPKEPTEDPKLVADRERERLMAEEERTAASQDLASGMTTDFRKSYLGRSLFSVVKK
jgi:hypothetical protein